MEVPADREPVGVVRSGAGPINQVTRWTDTRARCPWARLGVIFYRGRFTHWQLQRGADLPTWRRPRNCADARYLAVVWSKRSFHSRQVTKRYLHEVHRHTLRDFPFCEGCRAWHRAIEEVQKIFPGTSRWLLSCSAAEGGHGRWVGYAGVGYSTWLRDSDTVGGPLQFRFSTFTGMYRRAVEHAISKGFRVALSSDLTAAWRSSLGQALAGGWARYTGNDDSHWSASFGNGC